jgi:hypothetical protein
MPTFTTLVLTDREDTPVDHSFVPESNLGGVATLVEGTGVPLADSKFSIGQRKTPTRRKATIRLAIPEVQTETINGIDRPSVVRVNYANVEFSFDVASEEQERDNIVGMIRDALDPANTLVHDSVVKLQGIHG